jgi:peptidoglycan/LPS O-acetylase OafA/YrhL
MTKKSINKNLVSLDILRALAALLVYCCHGNIGGLVAKTTGIELFKVLDILGGKYAVPIFFILSGYCIELSVKNMLLKTHNFDIKNFYKRRIKRIYIPYLAALFFSIIVEQISNPNFKLTSNDFIAHILMLHGFSIQYFNTINIVFWTLTIELAFYILYPIYYYCKQKFGVWLTLLVISIASCTSILLLNTNQLIHPRDLFAPTNLFVAWCLGCALQDATSSQNKFFAIASYYCCSCIPLVILGLVVPITNAVIFYNFTVMGSGLILLFFLNVESRLDIQNTFVKILVAIGVSSYSLYLFHQPLINLKIYLTDYFIISQSLRNLTHVLSVPIIIFICYLIYVFFEKPFALTNKNQNKC